MKCTNCSTEFNGSFCPNCGTPAPFQPQGNVKVKKPIYKRAWFWVVIAVVVIGLFSAGGSNDEKPEASAQTTVSAADTTVKQTEETTTEKKVEETTTEKQTEEKSDDYISPEFKKAMDNYKKFFEEYVEFMENYDENSSALSALEYASFLTKYSTYMDEIDDIDEDELTDAECKYYIDTMAEIEKMLIDVAG